MARFPETIHFLGLFLILQRVQFCAEPPGRTNQGAAKRHNNGGMHDEGKVSGARGKRRIGPM